jgi:hypothetical protein
MDLEDFHDLHDFRIEAAEAAIPHLCASHPDQWTETQKALWLTLIKGIWDWYGLTVAYCEWLRDGKPNGEPAPLAEELRFGRGAPELVPIDSVENLVMLASRNYPKKHLPRNQKRTWILRYQPMARAK